MRKTCFEFIDNYPSYEYWLINTYILLSDNYLVTNDLFQAKATLQSVLNNYEKDDDLRKMAQNKFNQIVALEAQNSKIKLDNNSTEMEFEK